MNDLPQGLQTLLHREVKVGFQHQEITKGFLNPLSQQQKLGKWLRNWHLLKYNALLHPQQSIHFNIFLPKKSYPNRIAQSCNYCTKGLILSLHSIPKLEKALFVNQGTKSRLWDFAVLAYSPYNPYCQKSMTFILASHSPPQSRFLQWKDPLFSQTSESTEFQHSKLPPDRVFKHLSDLSWQYHCYKPPIVQLSAMCLNGMCRFKYSFYLHVCHCTSTTNREQKYCCSAVRKTDIASTNSFKNSLEIRIINVLEIFAYPGNLLQSQCCVEHYKSHTTASATLLTGPSLLLQNYAPTSDVMSPNKQSR